MYPTSPGWKLHFWRTISSPIISCEFLCNIIPKIAILDLPDMLITHHNAAFISKYCKKFSFLVTRPIKDWIQRVYKMIEKFISWYKFNCLLTWNNDFNRHLYGFNSMHLDCLQVWFGDPESFCLLKWGAFNYEIRAYLWSVLNKQQGAHLTFVIHVCFLLFLLVLNSRLEGYSTKANWRIWNVVINVV